MAGKTHPYISSLVASSIVFFSILLVIICLALYVHGKSVEDPAVPQAEIEKNLTPPGKVYPRQ